jgi:proline iminopeptidase
MNKQTRSTCTSIIVSVIVTFLITTPGCQDAESSIRYTEGFVHAGDDIELYYRIAGTGQDTLIMLHGGPGLNFDYLKPDLTPLEEHFTLIYYDQRGSGRSTLVSEPGSLGMESHLADLESVRRHFGLEKMTLFGHSWGAILASFYLLEQSDKMDKIVLSSPGPPRFQPYLTQLVPNIMAWMDESTSEEVERLRNARQDTTINARKSCDDFWEVFIRGYFSDPKNMDLIRSMRGDFCTGSEDALRNGSVVGTHTLASIDDYDLRDQLHHIDLPVLIITGIDDIFPARAMHEWDKAFANSRLVLMERSGHYPQIEQPEEYFRTVTEFLNDNYEK